MQVYDILMLAVLAAAIGFGFWKGLAWQIASFAAVFVSYAVAYQFRGAVAPLIDAPVPWNAAVGMVVLYVGTSLAIWIVFRFVKDFIEKIKLKDFDRHAGALLGAAKGAVLCIVITIFALALSGDSQRNAVCRSKSGYYIAKLLGQLDGAMPAEVQQRVSPYLDKLDRELQRGAEPERFAEQPQPPALNVPPPRIEVEIDPADAARAVRGAADAYWRQER